MSMLKISKIIVLLIIVALLISCSQSPQPLQDLDNNTDNVPNEPNLISEEQAKEIAINALPDVVTELNKQDPQIQIDSLIVKSVKKNYENDSYNVTFSYQTVEYMMLGITVEKTGKVTFFGRTR